MRLRKGKRIPSGDGLRVEELVGRISTGTPSVSVARVLVPPGWRDAPRTSDFDEVVVILVGELTQVVGGRVERLQEGELGLVPKGSRVTFRNDGTTACDFLSICAPAFQPRLAHAEPAERERGENVVQVSIAHPRGRRLERVLLELGEGFLRKLGLSGKELSISLVGDRAIRRLNRTWRKKDEATDVLSFPSDPGPQGMPAPVPLGDVVISLDTAVRRAREDGRPLEAELARYLAHGILHLLGYDHERSASEARRMYALEEKLLGTEGLIPTEMAFPRSRRRRLDS